MWLSISENQIRTAPLNINVCCQSIMIIELAPDYDLFYKFGCIMLD